MAETVRVPYQQVVDLLRERLVRVGMMAGRADRCARLFADASRDGVPSHGLNRFHWMTRGITEGKIDPNVEIARVAQFGAMERWDGRSGPGPWNAWTCMNRALELAGQFGIGCVGLFNTHHWMRAGNYGWQAADAGCIGICWTNTWPLMAPWGGKGRKIGNNPLVLAVPRAGGEHLVLDMAMSQYSMGKLAIFRKAGTDTDFPAGFNPQGEITRSPAEVLDGGTAMPIGYWKGAGLGLMLDVVAASVSGGFTTAEIGKESWEHRVSQLFLAIDPRKTGTHPEQVSERVLADLRAADPAAHYPGEGALRARRESLEQGVPIDADVWARIAGENS